MPPHSTTCDTLLIGRGSMAQNEWDWIHRNGTTYISAHGVKVPTFPKQTQKASSVIKSIIISTDGKEEVNQAPIETYTTEMIQEVQHLIPDHTQTHLHSQAFLHEKIGTWKQYDHLIQDYEQRFKKVVRDTHPTLNDCILLYNGPTKHLRIDHNIARVIKVWHEDATATKFDVQYKYIPKYGYWEAMCLIDPQVQERFDNMIAILQEYGQSPEDSNTEEVQNIKKIVFEDGTDTQDIVDDPEEDERQFFTPDMSNQTPDTIQKLIEEKIAQIELSEANKTQLAQVIRDQKQLFLTKGAPLQRLVDHEHCIDTEGPPFHEHFYRMSKDQLDILYREIDLMLAMDVIEESSSPWASRLLMVKKPDNSLRPCVDFRKLNDITKRQSNPLPNIDDLLTYVGKGKIYTKVDLYSGFWQIPLRATDREKNSLHHPQGTLSL